MSHLPVRSFPPVFSSEARVLILGSVPGVRSLQLEEYYGHPQNVFWRIMQSLFGVPHTLRYSERLQQLTRCGVALWDVLESCERVSSLDSDIQRDTVVTNDIASLLHRAPHITRIGLNGATAARYFRQHIRPTLHTEQLALPVVTLPSTSPAYAAMRPENKASRWAELLAVTPVQPYPNRL